LIVISITKNRLNISYKLNILYLEYNIRRYLIMKIDTNTMVSITEANQNFSKVARLVDEHGTAVILKNNVPRYLVIDFSKAENDSIASDEDIMSISKRLIEQNKGAYEVLAK
jgi:antitoxin Phd